MTGLVPVIHAGVQEIYFSGDPLSFVARLVLSSMLARGG
jgi:hypothetical protein